MRHDARIHLSRGVATIEFAIMLPVLLLLLLGTAELGRALYEYNALAKTVRDGARYLAEHAEVGSTGVLNISAEVDATTKNLVAYGSPAAGTPILEGLQPADVSVTTVGDEDVSVSATYSYVPLFLAIPTFGAGEDIHMPVAFQATTRMRAL